MKQERPDFARFWGKPSVKGQCQARVWTEGSRLCTSQCSRKAVTAKFCWQHRKGASK